MAFHTNNSRHGNKGEAAIHRRLAYASRRMKELQADGKTEAEAWIVIKQETKAGMPEKEHK